MRDRLVLCALVMIGCGGVPEGLRREATHWAVRELRCDADEVELSQGRGDLVSITCSGRTVRVLCPWRSGYYDCGAYRPTDRR